MTYSITWDGRTAQINYSGDIENKDIENAHFELNRDERFYDCRNLILNTTDCNLIKVSVPGLESVVALELGAAYTNKTLNVAMVANNPISIEKASSYIELFRLYESPWAFKIFNSIDDAYEWLDR